MSRPVGIADVWAAMASAKDFFLELPKGAYLPGMTRALTAGERMALAYLHGVLMAVGAHGVDTAHVVIELRTPDSEPL